MSVTRVPIPPLAKGSLTKLWLGVAAAVAIAGGTAWAGLQSVPQSAAGFLSSNADEPGVVTTESGLQFKELTKGSGPSPTDADVTLINYQGTLMDGTPFDANQRVPMPVAGSIPGFSRSRISCPACPEAERPEGHPGHPGLAAAAASRAAGLRG